jgi:hypothetical protein
MRQHCHLVALLFLRFQATGIPATSWVHYTTSCNTQSSAPEDGRDHRLKHVELIGIINKPLWLHLVGIYIIYINDAPSNKYRIYEYLLQKLRLYFFENFS